MNEEITVGEFIKFLTTLVESKTVKIDDVFIAHDEKGKTYKVSKQILTNKVKSENSGFICVGVKK